MSLEQYEKLIRTPQGKFFFNVYESNDTKLNVIHAHLIIEEVLTEILLTTFKMERRFESAKLQFHQKLFLCGALLEGSFPDSIFGALSKFNTIRNKYAHALEPQGIDSLIDDFINMAPKSIYAAKSTDLEKFFSNQKLDNQSKKLLKTIKWMFDELVNITSKLTRT